MDMKDLVEAINVAAVWSDSEKELARQLNPHIFAISNACQELHNQYIDLETFWQKTTEPRNKLIEKEPKIFDLLNASGAKKTASVILAFHVYQAIAKVTKNEEWLMKAFKVLHSDDHQRIKSYFLAVALDTGLEILKLNFMHYNQDLLRYCEALHNILLTIEYTYLDGLFPIFKFFSPLFGVIKKPFMEETEQDLCQAVVHSLTYEFFNFKVLYLGKIVDAEIDSLQCLQNATNVPIKFYWTIMKLSVEYCDIRAIRQSHYLCHAMKYFLDKYHNQLGSNLKEAVSVLNITFANHYITLIRLFQGHYYNLVVEELIEIIDLDLNIDDNVGKYPCENEIEAKELLSRAKTLIATVENEDMEFTVTFVEFLLIKNKLLTVDSAVLSQLQTLQ